MASAGRLSCPVRACGAPLSREPRRWVCPRGHAFDVARGGYVSLLQPQARRSRAPGDDAQAVAARERLADAGFDAALLDALERWWRAVLLPGGDETPALCDVGCGVGTAVARLARARRCEAFGLDLSTPAVRAAARRHRDAGVTFLVDNADRRLPFQDASLDAALIVKGPKPFAKLARVLRPGGALCVVVPGADDLVELRTRTAGGGLPRDPAARALEQVELTRAFELEARAAVREVRALAPDLLRDLLRVSYRGLRRAEEERARALAATEVTASAELLALRRAPA